MGPLDVQRLFLFPPSGAIHAGKRCAAALIQHGKRRTAGTVELRQAELSVERRRVADDIGIVVGVDDGDGLAGARAGNTVQANRVCPVGGPDLCRRISTNGGTV